MIINNKIKEIKEMNEIEEAQKNALTLAKHAESIGISYDDYCKACVVTSNSYIRCGGRNIEYTPNPHTS